MTNAWRVSIAAVMALVAGCGKGGEPSPGKGTSTGTGSGSGTGTGTGTVAPTPEQAARWKPIPRPPGSPACVTARQWFGYSATCVEQPLPELTTAAGTVRRLWSTSDPTRRWVYALTPPAGADVVAPSDSFSDGILYKVTQRLDLAKTPPEVLARLYAALSLQAAVVRCTADDPTPPKGCRPPRFSTVDGATRLTFDVEEFPHPALLARDKHALWRYQLKVEGGALSSDSGEQLEVLDLAAPPPPTAPPLPEMTIPADTVAAPVPAPPDVEAAVCKAAAELFQWKGRTCKAYGYPSIALPTGAIYYLANDAGERHALAVRKPDGTIQVKRSGDFVSPLTPLVATYDPAVVSPATFLAAYLLLDGKPARILCLPGSGDVLPNDPCPAPTAERRGDALVIRAVIEELAEARGMIGDNDPAVRSIAWEFTPGGGMTGDGFRLIDLRAP